MSTAEKPPHLAVAMCPEKGVRQHTYDNHWSDLAHNPWSQHCVKTLTYEPTCRRAVCRTCDSAPLEDS
ncbi:MAG: hypothetical protein NVS3B1_06040 [Marmoricola sp.]